MSIFLILILTSITKQGQAEHFTLQKMLVSYVLEEGGQTQGKQNKVKDVPYTYVLGRKSHSQVGVGCAKNTYLYIMQDLND